MAPRCLRTPPLCTTQFPSMCPPFLSYARLHRKCRSNLSFGTRMVMVVRRIKPMAITLPLAVS